MSAKGHVQAVTGEPVRTGRFPTKDSGPIEEIYSSTPEYLGHKRDPFAVQLGVEWAPGRIGRGVNDMHEAELMKYPGGKVSGETQHAFMDDVRGRAIRLANEKKLGGVDDWTTGTAQAAAWSGNKIRRGDLAPGDAAKSYADYFPLHEANATYEAIPGKTTGHLRGLLDAPYETKLEFTRNPAGSWNTSASGRDVGYTAARLLPGEGAEAVGRFEGISNPGLIARPVVGTETLDNGSRALTKGSKDALDLVEGARSYFDVQDAGAWHKLMPAKTASEYTGAHINFGRTLSEPEMVKLAEIFEKHKFYIATDPKGLTVMTNENTPAGKEFASLLRDIIKENRAAIGSPTVNMGRLESGYIDHSAGWPVGKGEVTRGLLARVDAAPKTAGLLNDSVAYRDAVLARNARDTDAAAKGLGVVREDILRAREIFAREGWEGLRRAANAGTVPAVFLTPDAMEFLQGSEAGQRAR